MSTIQLLQSHGYLTVFCGLLLEYLGLPIPGELILLFFGALVFRGSLAFWPLLVAGLAAVLLADHFWFLAGRRGGKRWLRWFCRATLGSAQCESRTLYFFKRFGPACLLFAKFVPGLRTFATPMAGMAGVPYLHFVSFDAIGTFLWVTGVTALGRLMATQLGALLVRVEHLGKILGLLFVLGVLAILIRRLAKRLKYGHPMAESDSHV